MATILGLGTTDKFNSLRRANIRARVFYHYPTGAAALMGLLSLIGEEETNSPEFTWYEKIMKEPKTVTAANTTGPFITNRTTNADAASPFSIAVNDVIRVIVTDASKFRVGAKVRFHRVKLNGGTYVSIIGRVNTVYGGSGNGGYSGVDGAKQAIDVQFFTAQASILNTADNVGIEALNIGSTAAEGQVGSSMGNGETPLPVTNYCEIMRHGFKMSGSAVNTTVDYDKTGPYRDRAQDEAYHAMCSMERTFIFGQKATGTDNVTGLPLRFTGGILYFLDQWEQTSNNIYGMAGASSDTDDLKRIITNSAGTMTVAVYEDYLERVFRHTNNKANEKLVLCGNGFLNTMQKLYRSSTTFQMRQGDEKVTFGMEVISHVTAFGTVHYRTHPLFNENSFMRYNALFLDIHYLKYRYLTKRNTQLLKNRQPNNADYREDEFLTEAGLEMEKPQSCLYLQNVAATA